MPSIHPSPSEVVPSTLVPWLALAPLAVGASTLPAALVLAAAVPAVVVAGRALAALAARVLPEPALRPVALLATAALIGVVALGLRALWPALGDTPYLLLPLALATALPIVPASADGTAGAVVRDGLRLGARFAVVVAATALARAALEPVLPLLGRPAGMLVLTGLVLAAAQWLDQRRAPAAESRP